MYCYVQQQVVDARGRVRLLGSGAILREVIAASELLASDWQIDSEVFSVTSFSELAREARDGQRAARLGMDNGTLSHVQRCLTGNEPVIAATDYVRAWPQLIAEYVQAPYVTLGTDGFGRSDTRQQLRRFFEVDRFSIVLASLHSLVVQGGMERRVLDQALERYGHNTGQAPWYG
jgi:pyruvate dehydrogenase E1 component